MQDLVKKLHPLERKVLPKILNCISLNELKNLVDLQEIEIMRALQWLKNKDLIYINSEEDEIIDLDLNGQKYLKEGLPEQKFIEAIGNKVLDLKQIANDSGLSNEEINACIGILKNKKAIEITKDKKYLLTNYGKTLIGKKSIEQELLEKLPLNINLLNKLAFDNLKKRKNMIKIEKQKEIYAKITDKGKRLQEFNLDEEFLENVTPELLKTGDWKRKEFRYYDLQAEVPRINRGKKHFVNEAIDYARRIWLDMGFKEMSGTIINTSFWTFDALFVPQDHPAREMQDTFFIKDPKLGKINNKELAKRIKETHETGWTTNSKGWQYKWDENIAKTLVPRTHTTVLSSQTLAKLKKEDLPAKFFAIGRCYRNEALDWSHLFEFNQTEGIVIDENANLRHLMGYLREFAKKMGYPKTRFRPAYFPYTSNSLEGDVYDPMRKKWIEFIAAGIFRPEVVKPLLGKEIPVLAWGPGLDRMIAASYELKDIRDLYKNDIKQLRRMRDWK